MPCFLLHILCWFSVGWFIWLRDRKLGSSCNLCLTWFGFFSGVPGARGALLIWFYSLVDRSLLIRDRESILWLKLVFGLCVVLFRWFGGREVCDSCMILRLGALRNVVQVGCWGLRVLFRGCSLWVSSDGRRWWISCLQCLLFFFVVCFRWWCVLVGLSSGVFLGGYVVPSICGTICILFRPYLSYCGDDV